MSSIIHKELSNSCTPQIRISLEDFIADLINKSNATTNTFKNTQQSSSSHVQEPKPISAKTLAEILSVLPYVVNTYIFKYLSYTRLYSLSRSQNQDIKFAAQKCLINKFKQQLHISYADRETYLDIFNILLKSFYLLSARVRQAPPDLYILTGCESFEFFLTNLESISLNLLLSVNQYIFENRRTFDKECMELFFIILANKINGNQTQVALLERRTLRAYIYGLLAFSLTNKKPEILKRTLTLFPKIATLHLLTLVDYLKQALNVHFYEYIELILEHLFTVENSDETRDGLIFICISIFNGCILCQNIEYCSQILNKMPLSKEEARASIQSIRSSIEFVGNAREGFRTHGLQVIHLLQQHYNV